MTHRLAKTAGLPVRATLATWKSLVNSCRAVLIELTTKYHPEAHYMRGPGPKWRQKHAAGGTAS
jgi:hypothetical protein